MMEALGRLRQDSMTVERTRTETTEYGAEREEYEIIYEGAPCRLSFSAQAVHKDRDGLPDVQYTATLFASPEYALHPGDRVTVARCGAVYTGEAGESARYPSHSETPLSLHRR